MSIFKKVQLKDQYGFSVEHTPMDEIRTITPYRILGSTFSGTTIDTNFWTVTNLNGGTASQANNQITMTTGSSANGSTILTSAMSGRYMGGTSLRYRAVIRHATSGAANNIRNWGYFNTTDGCFFQLNGSTLNIVTRKTSSDTAVAAASWNGTTFTIDNNVHNYEIYFTNTKVYFVIDGVLRHTVTASTTTWADSLNLTLRFENTNSGGSTTIVTSEIRVHTMYSMGEWQSRPRCYRTATAETRVLKYGPGVLHHINVSGAGSVGDKITLYDNTAASGNMNGSAALIVDIAKISGPVTLNFDEPFSTGLTYTTVGTTEVSVHYE